MILSLKSKWRVAIDFNQPPACNIVKVKPFLKHQTRECISWASLLVKTRRGSHDSRPRRTSRASANPLTLNSRILHSLRNTLPMNYGVQHHLNLLNSWNHSPVIIIYRCSIEMSRSWSLRSEVWYESKRTDKINSVHTSSRILERGAHAKSRAALRFFVGNPSYSFPTVEQLIKINYQILRISTCEYWKTLCCLSSRGNRSNQYHTLAIIASIYERLY